MILISQRSFWAELCLSDGAQAVEKALPDFEWLAIIAIIGSNEDHFYDQGGGMLVGLNLLLHFFRPQPPADVTGVADLVIGCNEGDLFLSLCS